MEAAHTADVSILLAAPGVQTLGKVAVWVGLLALAVLVLGVVMHTMKKRIRRTLTDADHWRTMPFTLSQLRKMHRDGDLTDSEFTHLRAKLLQQLNPDRAEPPTQSPTQGRPPNQHNAQEQSR